MGDVTRYTGSAVPAQRPATAAAAASSGRSVDTGDWSGTVLTYEAMVGRAGTSGDEIASMARLEAGARRRGSPPTYFRRRVGWRAHRTGIQTALSEQRLAPQPDGRFRPVGAWSNAVVNDIRADGQPTRLISEIAHDKTFGDGEAPQPGGRGIKFASAEAEVAYLPESLRRVLATRVASPTFFEAEALRYSAGHSHYWHTVTALKMDQRRALVVVASRQFDAPTWQVEQITYDLAPVLPQLRA